jgi:hypothetical protein
MISIDLGMIHDNNYYRRNTGVSPIVVEWDSYIEIGTVVMMLDESCCNIEGWREGGGVIIRWFHIPR